MKMIQTLLATIAVIAFTGCATPNGNSFVAKMSSLQPDMTKDQVIQILGKPTAVGTGTHYGAPSVTISDGFSEVFRYTQSSRKQTQDWIVVFFHGKLTEYGQFAGDLRMRYGGVFTDR